MALDLIVVVVEVAALLPLSAALLLTLLLLRVVPAVLEALVVTLVVLFVVVVLFSLPLEFVPPELLHPLQSAVRLNKVNKAKLRRIYLLLIFLI